MEYIKFNYPEYYRWVKDRGDETLRLNYNLNSQSIVFDAGGYKGEWSEKIYKKYKCKIYIFEPIKKLYDDLKIKFKDNKNINIYNFGLSDRAKKVDISLKDDGSSVYLDSSNKESIKLESLLDFIKNNNIEKIDLFKINVEGEEFNILENLVNDNYINNVKNIQVQFHNFIEHCVERRNNIRKKLNLTHKATYNYEFIWENWELQ